MQVLFRNTKLPAHIVKKIGAVRGIDPRSGHYYDDTKRYIDATPNLDDAQRKMVFEGNARRVFSRFPL